MNPFHLFKRDDNHYLFEPSSYTLTRVSADLYRALEENNQNEPEVKKLLEKIGEHCDLKKITPHSAEQPLTLYLNVSNACNLHCSYCYANYGSYSSKPGMMTEETAFESVTLFYKTHGAIGTIVFFGGEPLLHPDLIPQVCDYATVQSRFHNVPPPHFSIVTNGTLLTEENVAVLKKYKFGVTVSMDGPKEIHDLLRPDNSGKGSYDAVTQGLLRLKNAGIATNVECTFTSQHLKNDVRPIEILKLLRDKFGTRTVTLSPVASDGEKDFSLDEFRDSYHTQFVEAVQFCLSTLSSENPIMVYHAQHIMNAIQNRQVNPKHKFCYANLGKDLLVVNYKGDIFPCQMMNDQPEKNMGNIQTPQVQETQKFKEVQDKYADMNRDEMQCKNCWAKGFCFICIAGVEIETGKMKPIPKHRCDLVKTIGEEVLHYLAS